MKDQIMSGKQYFATAVTFTGTADNKGCLPPFDDFATVVGGDVQRLGKTYIKTDSPCRDATRSIKLQVAGISLPIGEYLSLAKQPVAAVKPAMAGCEIKGEFKDCHPCVPGFDPLCDLPQPGIDPPAKPIVGSQFAVNVSLSGYAPGDFVRGSILLEVLPPPTPVASNAVEAEAATSTSQSAAS